MSAPRIEELRAQLRALDAELVELNTLVEQAKRTDQHDVASGYRGDIAEALNERADAVAELRGLESSLVPAQADARFERFVDTYLAELIEMSDEEVLAGKDPAEVQAWGHALVASAKRTALVRRVVAKLDEEGFLGFDWRYRDGKVQAGKSIPVEYITTDAQGYPRYSHGEPFTVWVDVPSLARVLAAKRAEERALVDDELPF